MDERSHDARSQAESIYVEWLARAEAGGAEEFEALVAAHAAHAPALRAIASDLQRLQSLEARTLPPAEPDSGTDSAEIRLEELAWRSPRTAEILRRLRAHSAAGARYERGDTLGLGGQGRVVEARDLDLRRRIALKSIREDRLPPLSTQAGRDAFEAQLHRFFEEAQVTAQLDHPGIVPVHELGVDARGRPYFAMAVVEGADLHEVFARVRRNEDGWSFARALNALVRACETVAYAHSKGVIHRDLKPSNVMVGSFGAVYVVDWGLARVLGASEPARAVSTERRETIASDPSTPIASVLERAPGTANYMPPEQAGGGELDARADVYAAGAILYELLAGRAPYAGASPTSHESVRRAVLAGPPEALSSLAPRASAELVAIAEKAMSRDPRERYADMRALAADLSAFLEQRAVRAYRTGPLVDLAKWARRNRGLASASALALLATIGGLVTYLRMSEVQAAAARERLRTSEERAEEQALRLAERESFSRQVEIQNTQLTAQNAELLVRAANLAGQRGRWAEAIEALGAARTSGYPRADELDLAEARALVALNRGTDARAILERVASTSREPEAVGTACLLLGDLAMADWELREAEAVGLVQRALAHPLAPADREYGLALLADTTRIASMHLDRALAFDAFHHGAHGYRLMLRVFRGEHEQALSAAESFRSLFPDDPMSAVATAIVAALHGDSALEARAMEGCRRSLDAETVGALASYCDAMRVLIREVDPDYFAGGGKINAAALMNTVLSNKRLVDGLSRGTSLGTLGEAGPNLPALRRGIWAGANGMWGLIWQHPQARDHVWQARHHHDDVLLRWFESSFILEEHDWSLACKLDTMERAVELLDTAEGVPSIVPVARRAAKFTSARCHAWIAGNAPERRPEASRRARERLRWFLGVEDPRPTEFAQLAGDALDHLGDPALASALLDRLEETLPAKVPVEATAAAAAKPESSKRKAKADAKPKAKPKPKVQPRDRHATLRARIQLAQGNFDGALETLRGYDCPDEDSQSVLALEERIRAQRREHAQRWSSDDAR